MVITLRSTTISSDESSITIHEDRVTAIQNLTARLNADIDIVTMACDEDMDSQPVTDAIARIKTRTVEARHAMEDLQDEGIEYVMGWDVYENLCDAISNAGDILFDSCVIYIDRAIAQATQATQAA